jgi:uncharacterized protein YggL (DUF469 family)
MRKRLRKKKHIGEFTAFGCLLTIDRKPTTGIDEFMDAFISDAIEANGCYCGGGGTEDRLEFVVELGRKSDNPEGRIKQICNWLDSRQNVEDYKLGELTDLWYGEF